MVLKYCIAFNNSDFYFVLDNSIAWIELNCSGNFLICVPYSVIFFENEIDAMIFKLCWAN